MIEAIVHEPYLKLQFLLHHHVHEKILVFCHGINYNFSVVLFHSPFDIYFDHLGTEKVIVGEKGVFAQYRRSISLKSIAITEDRYTRFKIVKNAPL